MTNSRLTFHSSDKELERGFDLLKSEALSYVFEGYPVGDYYEAALPTRNAFCMRDTSHQCIGAEVLGLSKHNLNMMHLFAKAISPSRDYCSYWEIDRTGSPCPVDYKDDSDFWYNLPANFDIVDAILRLYKHTGNAEYLQSPDFINFCSLSMNEYIRKWNRTGDGIPKRDPTGSRRGIASYNEEATGYNIQVGFDLICILARAYMSCAELCRLNGNHAQEKRYRELGQKLLSDIETVWIQPGLTAPDGMDADGQIVRASASYEKELEPLYRRVLGNESARPLLDSIFNSSKDMIIELFSHVPETLWAYGREEQALAAMYHAMDPALPRREYPEASYSAIGALFSGLMGITPDGEHNSITTCSGLSSVEWASLEHAKVLDGFISVEHTGHTMTKLTNECSHPIEWTACFSQPTPRRFTFTVEPGQTVSACAAE